MACAANYAWANRQMIMHLTEQALLHALRISPKDLNLRLVYDVAHNIAKLETHEVDGVAGGDLRAPQGSHPGLRTGPAGGARRTTARSGSRCSFPATWGRPRSCARAPRRP